MKHNSNTERLAYLHEILKVLPEQPGVYQYFDVDDKIIYVGKAKNLKRRVSSYFLKEQKYGKTIVLVSKITDIKFIVVQSEHDAFLLENNLIKLHQPRYNILLKDGKTYPWIKVTGDQYPRVFQTRNKVADGGKYYGPYPSVKQVYYLLNLINDLFPLRNCALPLTDSAIKAGRYDVCLKYHIKSCCAPCVGKITQEEYSSYVSKVHSILQGRFSDVISSIKEKMQEEAMNLNFEAAAALKDKIDSLQEYQSRSIVASVSKASVEVLALVDEKSSSNVFVNHMHIEEGRLLHSFTYKYSRPYEQTAEEIMSHAFQMILEQSQKVCKEVVVNVVPDEEFSQYTFNIPQAGEKLKLLELSKKNAFAALYDQIKHNSIRNRDSKEETLLQLVQQRLSLRTLPEHIECFDNSNIQGSFPVASCVVFKNAKPSKSDYRKFNIKTVEGPDDYASMREVVYRRYSRLINEEQPLPNVVIADGGEGQMKIIHEVLCELGIQDKVELVGLAKNAKHKTQKVLVGFPPLEVDIPAHDDIFAFFSRIQEEVHRFAITFHREKRSSAMTQSELDGIKGIGPKTKQVLIDKYKTLSGIGKAPREEIEALIGNKKASILFEYIDNIK